VSRAQRRMVITGMLATVTALGIGGAVLVARRAVSPATSTDLEQLGRYGEVPSFALTERSGRRVTRESLRGSIWVVDFIYTKCTESCPIQSLELAQLQREFTGAADLRLVSITVDPAHDTPEVLRTYAARYGASDRWWFLTGEKQAIYCLAREGFRLAVVDPRSAEPPDCRRVSWLAPAALGRATARRGS
jgi:protein SCO1